MGKGKAPTKQDVSRIMKSEANKHGGQVPKGNWVGRIQSGEAKTGQNAKKEGK